MDATEEQPLSVYLDGGRIKCFDIPSVCIPLAQLNSEVATINLEDGYMTPGLVAFGNDLGLRDIPSEPVTMDGSSETARSSQLREHEITPELFCIEHELFF